MADKPEVKDKSDDVQGPKGKGTKGGRPDFSADDVGGLFEGLGQGFRELVAGRAMWELIVMFLMALMAAKFTVKSVEELIQRDPQLRKLKTIQKQRLIETMSAHLDHFCDRGRDGILAVKNSFVGMVKKAYTYLTQKDSDGATAVQGVVAKVQADTDGICERRRKIGFNPRSWRHAFSS
ncbi:MAG: hypothetical protein V1685_01055 [Parcubacteria group bacterium]